MKKITPLSIVILLAPFVFSFAFALDVYIPAVPQMKELLHTTQANIQLTLSIFMFMTGIGQLVFGPAADQFGRRKIAITSVVFFTVGSLLCAVANSIGILLIARVIQSLGGCGMLVVAFAIVRDLFSGNESAKVYSFLNCGLGMSPLFAPIIGSYLVSWFNWRAGFVFLAVMGMAILVVSIVNIKETLPVEKRVKVDKGIFLRYLEILTNSTFITYAFCATAGLTIFFVFFSSSPYIIMNLLHAPVEDFGYYFFIIGFMFFLGSFLSGKIAGIIGSFKAVLLGSSLMLLAGLSLWVWYQISGVSTYQYLVPCMLAGIGGAIMMGAGLAGAMEPFPEVAGSAAALAGCLEFLCSALVGTYVMHWIVQSTMPLAITMTSFSLLALIAIVFYGFYKLRITLT